MPDFSWNNIWNALNPGDLHKDSVSGQDIELPNPQPRLIPPKPRTWMDAIQDPTKPIRDYFHNQQDDYSGPTSNPSGESKLPTDALGLFSQDFSPEGANPLEHGINPGHFAEAATPLVPRELLKKRAQSIADSAESEFKNYPNLKQVVQDMSEKHPYVVGNLSRIEPSRQRNTLAAFWSHDTPYTAENLRQIIEDPATTASQHPNSTIRSLAGSMLNTTAEERIKKLGDLGGFGVMPRITIGGNQETVPIAQNYSTMRHELSHANDYIYRPGDKGEYHTYPGPGYWVSRPEVRARAVERNFGRDMGILDANKTRGNPISGFDPSEIADLHDVDPNVFHELNALRERYGDKIAAELATGSQRGGMLSKYGTNRVILTPAGQARKTAETRNIAADTYNHFFALPGNRTQARLKPPEKFDIHGISQGTYSPSDILKDLF